jgi:hypothetical protein
MGISNRFKYRVRFYNFDLNHINLEKKIKRSNLTYKQKVKLNFEQYQRIMTGDVSELMREKQNPLLSEFCMMSQTRAFVPKAIVQYERIAFVEMTSNTRITLDTNIVASHDFTHADSENKFVFPVLTNNMHVLEVKYDDFLPEYIRRIVQMDGLNQNTLSKYCSARHTLIKNWRF